LVVEDDGLEKPLPLDLTLLMRESSLDTLESFFLEDLVERDVDDDKVSSCDVLKD
jgi:hypothetical protein